MADAPAASVTEWLPSKVISRMVPAVSGQESGTFPVRSESHTATVARWMVTGSFPQ